MARLHLLILALFAIAQPLALASAGSGGMSLKRCGGIAQARNSGGDMPVAPLNDNHCTKVCHSGCIRKRHFHSDAD